jgi:CTP:molybdopterin cytidylyltransferase MocA
VTVAAVLLAAGGGTRFHGDAHKLIAELGGRPVYQHAVDAVTGAGLAPIVVVTGAVELSLPDGVSEVHNPRWADGQAGSLHAALAHLGEVHPAVDAIVVGLADQPFVPADAWAAVASAPPEWPIVVASYDGRRGPNPVRLHRSTWPRLPSSGDEGARSLIRENPQLVWEVPCSGSAADIDTLEDLKRWTSS